ncbi:uncharacterized Golgi apparatus membrane protein-like protein CG5021 [Frankliniella occidentalis]|uniref:Golgi apparatus membrane protein TVP23 homolog n=1 Tax=Frankliniella occidentalis TaxID=133901 RepID=A0A6J1SNF3_FRAOC|nr:uncharacterized Golgi apparatus membrane protein-like protein CG5021 [Frankliniella occidentalis]
MASAKVPLLTDTDDTIGFGEEDNINSSSYRHPYVIFFHLLFRSVALITYLFGTFVSNSFIAIFVTLILLLSMDFWTVKNITGRLLVGLRWWNYVDDNGKSHWVYESRKGTQSRVHPREARVFWFGLTVFPVLWAIFLIFGALGLSFKWMLVTTIALLLHGANLYGYIKCRFGSEKSMSTNVTDFFRKQVIQNVANIMTKPTQPSANAASATGVV